MSDSLDSIYVLPSFFVTAVGVTFIMKEVGYSTLNRILVDLLEASTLKLTVIFEKVK